MSVIEYPPKPIHKLKRQQLETVCIALEGMRDEAIRQRDDARAKLAAAEQERDRLNGQLDAVRSADREIIWRQAAELAQLATTERERDELRVRVAAAEALLPYTDEQFPIFPDQLRAALGANVGDYLLIPRSALATAEQPEPEAE